VLVAGAVTLAASHAAALDVTDTRLLSDPALSADQVAFAYANDLWVAARDGTDVRRLTSHPGIEEQPRFSPDGRLIAFTGQYEGNTDVYVMPSRGGEPRRLTWHPGADRALGFTPDGRSILFSSPRTAHTTRHLQLFTVPVEGGMPTRLPVPHAAKAAYSPDGRLLAYVPLSDPFEQWKHYRGGQAARILVMDVRTLAIVQVPQPAGRCNDTDPRWLDGTLYFRSDRDGEFNIYAYEPASQAVTRVTRHLDFPVLGLAAASGQLLYEQAGYLHLLEPRSSATARRLKIGVAVDLVETRARYAQGAKWLRNASLSPSGTRAAVEYRGEILTLPREKGDDRNLTRSPGVHDRSPAWSPDGRTIAWFSDAGGRYGLHVAPQDGSAPARRIELQGAGFYANLRFSPDAKWLSYTDNAHALFVLELASGAQTRVDGDPIYGPAPVLHQTWSPDSQWLAYTRNSTTYIPRIWLYSLRERRSYPVTDGLSDARHPVFDPNGKYLYFLASTDAGPVQDWFSLSSTDLASSRSLYLVVLAKGEPSPLAKESDEESGAKPSPAPSPEPALAARTHATPQARAALRAGAPIEPGGASAASSQPPRVVIDVDGLAERIVALPPKPAGLTDLQVGASGQLYYRKEPGAERGEDAALVRYDLAKRKEDTLLDALDAFELSADGKRVLVRIKEDWSICDLGDKLDLAKQRLNVASLRVRVEPAAEWRQIFDEAWRINRDYFYDPGMHGADWNALRAKYAAFLPDVPTRRELTRVMQWLFSELAVGHHRMRGGDTPYENRDAVDVGLLGADYEIDAGRYRFAKVFGGLNWNPELRAPLAEPGVAVRAGEYLLAVEGQDLRPPEDLFARFERTVGRQVQLTVGPSPDGRGARTVKVVPIDSEAALRNRDWVEGNLRRVTAASQGRVAYVWVPDTGARGYTYFKRYFFPQSDRDAIIVDERYNGGGQVADYVIETLARPTIAHWAMRYGQDLKTPIAGIHGPKVMLIDESAGSGGDLLPWMFRKLKLGTLVGRRTWGGLVGILGFPVLMDGATVTAPNLGIWTEDGFIVENEGVPPDVDVEQTPADYVAGRDPQLERALEIVLRELQAQPPRPERRPPFPVRVKTPH
jgi:tricorn protease